MKNNKLSKIMATLNKDWSKKKVITKKLQFEEDQ